MRLMEVEGVEGSALVSVCLHCGTESESRPPYEVRYCYCRSRSGGSADGWHDALDGLIRAA